MKLKNSTLKNKSAPQFYEKVGQHIISWLAKNKSIHEEPGTQKELVDKLKKLGVNVTTSQLSRYISGENEMPARIVTALVDHLGFKSSTFSDYYIRERDNLQLDLLTKEDLYKLIAEQTLIIQEWKDINRTYGDRFNKFYDENHQLVLGLEKSIKDNEKLSAEIRELRRKIKQLENDTNK